MIKLIVNSDDFGMCHSVNVGVLKAFQEGILTQSTIMPPSPWFEEGIAMAKEHSMPIGVHLTTACDFDLYKYKPISGGRSLVRDDGSFYNTVAETREAGTSEEIEAELRAQIDLVIARGITPTHIDVHMDVIDEDMIVKLLREYGIHGRKPVPQKYTDCIYQFDSFGYGEDRFSSSMPREKKKGALEKWLKSLPDGFHFLCGHCAVESDEMISTSSDGSPWAQEYRAGDLATFTDPDIIALVKELDIKLISFDQVDINGNLL